MHYTEKTMLAAMTANDSRYDGRFYVGVLSTGIYCLPSCRARTPKPANVRFFPTREEAVAFGLRGCRRCRSDRYPDILPDWVKRLVVYLRENRTKRINEHDLSSAAGVDITTIRRHFKTHLGMTPLAFNRYQRLLHAKQLLAEGVDALEAALACGYESQSGFRTAFIRQFGRPPGSIGKEKQ
jgi:AraC family transcriptional regulator of adaptative response/methylated-DNA-[protein]-cysteine methyltransferase